MLAEPMTLLTDYLMAGVTAWAAVHLFRSRDGQVARSYWTLAFAASAVAAALGGTYHGFAQVMEQALLQLAWKVTVLAIGIASFGMVAGSATAVVAGSLRKLLLAFAAVQFALYAWWMAGHDDYIYVIADTAIAMALVAVLHAWPAIRSGDRSSAWIVGGIGVSVLAAGVQASGIDLHRNFNHNDLYHVIQIAAIPLFFRGAAALRDRATAS